METIDTLPSRRSANGAVDIDYYRAHANRLRAAAMHEALKDLAAGLAKLAQRAGAAIHAWRQRRAAYRELSALDAQALHDIGISRGEIEAVANGGFGGDSSRCRKHYALALDNPAVVESWRERERPGIRATALAPCTR
jgi:uncharacterized protein YjiS (DUF1127 family)